MFIHSRIILLLSCAGNDIEEDDYILPDGRDVSELKDRDAVWGNAWHIPDPEDPQARHVLHFLKLDSKKKRFKFLSESKNPSYVSMFRVGTLMSIHMHRPVQI